MKNSISGFFLLVLRVSFKFPLDIVNKSLQISKVFPEECFELEQCDWSGTLVTALVLSPLKANRAIKD